MRPRLKIAVAALLLAPAALAADGNRLAYLDDPVNPYYPGRDFARLTTPQWVGEDGVEAVVVLAIDDMADNSAKYEADLRPILERLKRIDGRAPVSIMTNRIDPADPQLKTWLDEGLSLEVHTLTHPCPLLQKGDFDAARKTYHGGVDLLNKIPGSTPVAFRMPCCDSRNTPSPRFYAELFNGTSPDGRFLAIDSSVFNIPTADDPELPRELVLDPDGRERFRKYLPFKSFVNTIEDYPYPYVIGGRCWQFPCVVPSDWEGQNLHKPNNPRTVEDMKAALDAVVIKQGVFNLVFHPHGWIKADQVVELIDHAEQKHEGKVKFLTFREAKERLDAHLLRGEPLRDPLGGDNGVRLLDLDGDNFLDVVIGNDRRRATRVWEPEDRRWRDTTFPTVLVSGAPHLAESTHPRFGVVRPGGRPSLVVRSHGLNDRDIEGAWTFDGEEWIEDKPLLAGLPRSFLTGSIGVDQGVRMRDINGDGVVEFIVSSDEPTVESGVFAFSSPDETWRRLPFGMPEGAHVVISRSPERVEAVTVADVLGQDGGLRLVDLDEDGGLDIVFSNDVGYGIFLFDTMESGWSRRVDSGEAGKLGALPPIVRVGGAAWLPRASADGPIRHGGPGYVTDNGFWAHSRHLWWQNEDTASLPDLVDRRSFNDLLKKVEPTSREPEASLRSIRVRPGFRVELAAAEPLVRDPIAFDWSADGRLWVVEMGDYPLGEDGQGKPGGRVVVLTDDDGDGRYDRSSLFLDGLGFPNGIMCWRDGVLMSCAPDILYAEDADGDGRADVREPLIRGFAEANPQHRVNGFALGLDGWVYAADGDSPAGITSTKTGETIELRGRDLRFRPDTGAMEAEAGRSQYGRRRDDWGNWFGNNNSVWAWHVVLTDPILRRNPASTVAVPWNVLLPDRHLSPISPTLPRFNDLDNAGLATSANSPEPYRDDLFGPSFAPSVFVSEPVHNLVRRVVIEPDGVTFAGHRAADEADREFLASSDPWFRPTQIRTGPDGALYVADMDRAVIEHPEWIPDDWEARIDLRAGHDRGRIYRVLPVGVERRAVPRLDRLDPAGLVAAMDSPNGWVRDTCQRLLLHRGDRSVAPALAQLARDSARPKVRVQALATLDCLGSLDAETLIAALADPHAEVRKFAAERSGRLAADSPRLADALIDLADDPEPRVRMGVALGLGDWNGPLPARAAEGLASILVRDGGDPWLRAAALAASGPHADRILPAVLAASGAEGPRPAVLTPLIAAIRSGVAKGDADEALAALARPDADGRFADWQLAGYLAVRDQSVAPQAGFDRLRDAARSIAVDPESPAERRALAARVLAGRALSEDSRRTLGRLLGPTEPPAVREAAIEALATARNPEVSKTLLDGWKSQAPATRVAILDAVVGREAWASELLNQLEDGCLPPSEIGPTHRRRLMESESESIRDRAQAVFAAVDANRRAVVDRYRESMAGLEGDPTRGAERFSKACATCHRLKGQGSEVGPDLSALTDRTPEALLVAILDPNRSLEPTFAEYAVASTDGRAFHGIVVAESSAGVTIRQAEGKDVTLPRAEIEAIASTGRSLMPEGLENDLSPADLADLIAHVAASGPPPKEVAGNRPEVVRQGDAGAIELKASQAEIYGPSLTFEGHYGNLGFWIAPDDRTAWTVEVARPGRYEVRLDYACHDSTAGRRYVIAAGAGRIDGTVAGTGTWDEYREAKAGELTLPAGRVRVEMFATGPIDGALLDLRAIRLVPLCCGGGEER